MADGTAGLGTALHTHLGVHWLSGGDATTAAVEMDLTPAVCGPSGTLEGGVIATLVDIAGASAATRATGAMVATEHLSVSYLAPGRVGPIRATGVALRIGRHDVVTEVRIVDRGQDERLMAVALVTLRILEPRA